MKWFLVTSAVLIAGAGSAAADPLRGDTLAHTCAGCHGTLGAPASSFIPPLAGLTVEEFTRAMVAYRDGTRVATMMTRIAPAFSDDEIQAMAEFFAALPRPEGARRPVAPSSEN